MHTSVYFVTGDTLSQPISLHLLYRLKLTGGYLGCMPHPGSVVASHWLSEISIRFLLIYACPTVERGGVVSDFLALVTLRSSCVVSLPDPERRVAGVFVKLRCVDALRIRVGWQGSVSSSGCVDDEGRVTHRDFNWTTSWVVEVFDRRDQGIVNCHIDGQFGIS